MRLPTSILASAVLLLGLASAARALDSDDAKLPIVGKYLDASRVQEDMLRGAQMEMDIDAKLPKLEKQGSLRVLRIISRLGKISFKTLGFSGDNTIKDEVIARYLALERDAHENSAIAITPTNYKFRLSATLTEGDQKFYIFQLTPKKKRVGLFKGEIWLDSQTGMPVREAGQFVKSPSFFIKKVKFVQEFALKDGVSVPAHIESTVDTRIAGRAELSINFSNYTYQVQDQENDSVDEDSPGH